MDNVTKMLDNLLVEEVALAIGRVITQGEVQPVKAWARAAEAAIKAYEDYPHKHSLLPEHPAMQANICRECGAPLPAHYRNCPTLVDPTKTSGG